ncbi:hypothetical protein [Streptomyces sp. NPDC057854]|uniref:hypothetical protein n=1 Tax=unclassified Streptomyces TaxID=2593676 RepID=UPI0036AC5CDF
MTGNEARRRRSSGAALCLSALLVLGAGLSGCAQDDPDEPPAAAATPATRVCDGALDEAAAKALERLGGTQGFYESPGENPAGEPYTFAFSKAVASLRDGLTRYAGCGIHLTNGTKDSRPISFWIEAREDPLRKEGPDRRPERVTYYPLGVYADTRDGTSALLQFRCRVGKAGHTRPYLAVQMSHPDAKAPESATSKDRMTVLTSFARTLADELGCAGEARLPAEAPDPVSS